MPSAWCCLVPVDAQCQEVPSGALWCLLAAVWCCQVLPNASGAWYSVGLPGAHCSLVPDGACYLLVPAAHWCPAVPTPQWCTVVSVV